MSDPRNPPEDGGAELDPGFIDDEADEGGGGTDDLDETLAEGDEGEGEDGGEPGGEPEPGAQQPQQRQRRPSQAERRARRLEDEVTTLKGQLQLLTQQRPQQPAFDPAAAARAQREEEERLATMGPAEAARYFYEKGQREIGQALAVQNLQTQDRIDRQGYEAEARTSRLHREYRQRVEDALASERARNPLSGVTREALLHYLVGKDAVERASRAAPQQRRMAANRVNGQRTQPGSARGDGARGDRVPADQYEADKRLIANKPLW